MGKFLYLLPAFFLLAACASAPAADKKPRPAETPILIPVPTLDYIATISANQTQIANLSMTQTWATAGAEERAQENIRLTALVHSWTATAALTAIPATQTQQAVINTQVSEKATQVINQATWTAAVPTQIFIMADAKAKAETATLREITTDLSDPLRWVFGIVIVVCCSWIIARREKVPVPVATKPQALSAQPRFVNKSDSRSPFGEYITPPGNAAYFTKFALLVRSGAKGFSKPEWETADSPYNRQTYLPVYNWLWQHKFVQLKPGGKIELTHEGGSWLDR